MLRAVWVRFFWFGSRGGLLGSTPSKNEVSARSCLPVLSDLRLFVDVGDFASVLRGTDCFDCRSGDTGTIRAGQGAGQGRAVSQPAQSVSEVSSATKLVPQSCSRAQKGKSADTGSSSRSLAG